MPKAPSRKPRQQFNCRLPEETIRVLRKLAKKHRLSLANVIVQLAANVSKILDEEDAWRPLIRDFPPSEDAETAPSGVGRLFAMKGPNAASAYLGSSPAPAPALPLSLGGLTSPWATRAFVASDAVAFAEAPEIERTDPQTERFEMRPHFAGPISTGPATIV